MEKPHFRADIEGLRALAVAGVILFHLGLPWAGGGYLGVDIFFVISGFLITGLLSRDMVAGRFSLAAFYQRRVARILPALLLMLLGVLGAAVLLYLPSEMRALRAPATSAALFLSNIYFFRRDPYFVQPSEVQPLLHTWSLGVEEQFYLLYPLLLRAGGRWGGKARTGLVLILSLLSLGAAVLLAPGQPEAAFYLLPPRFWELGLGGLVALLVLPRPAGRRLTEPLCAAAVAGLVLAMALTGRDAGSPFPAALLPCAATAVLLAWGEGSLAGRVLSLAPLRFLGRISYSLYLWHWPVIVLWRLRFGFEMSALAQAGLVAVTLGLAILSWAAVEQPLRRRLRRGHPWPIVIGGGACAAAIALLAWTATTAEWRLRPLPRALLPIADVRDQQTHSLIDPNDPACRPTTLQKTIFCLRVVPGMRNILLAGDSHAKHLWPALLERFPRTHVLASIQIGCRPLLRGYEERPGCVAHVREGFERARRLGVREVILAARWAPEEMQALKDTILTLRRSGMEVIVVGPVVEYVPAVPELLARAMIMHDRSWIDRARLRERERLDRAMDPLVRAAGGRYFSAYRQECPPGRPCLLLTRTGRPFHVDYGHYTKDGARQIVAAMPPP
jgi:peptidoglycan/LPS O-acetylase OafA/YrhL